MYVFGILNHVLEIQRDLTHLNECTYLLKMKLKISVFSVVCKCIYM